MSTMHPEGSKHKIIQALISKLVNNPYLHQLCPYASQLVALLSTGNFAKLLLGDPSSKAL